MDSLKKVVDIMEYVENNNKKLSETDLTEKFGSDGFYLFSRYCLGGQEEYARLPDGEHFSLTQKGVRRLHDLRKTINEGTLATATTAATIVIALFTVVQAIGLYLLQ